MAREVSEVRSRRLFLRPTREPPSMMEAPALVTSPNGPKSDVSDVSSPGSLVRCPT